MLKTTRTTLISSSYLLFPLFIIAHQTHDLPTLYLSVQQTANTSPVATYQSPVSNLEFEPRVDLQSRNMAEAQGDVVIRGGTFEATGFKIGSATLIDPQTGHYFAEIPVAPEMLTRPKILTGSENAFLGFNSTAGTISYGWNKITDGGNLTLGGGDNGLQFQRLHHAFTQTLNPDDSWQWAAEAEFSRSKSDGTIRFGDHDFNRTTGRVQLVGPHSQTDFFGGYQSKFFGWPQLYAAPFGANETESLKTRLLIVNHTQEYGDNNHWEATTYFRRHSDHYIFERSAPNKNFVHETKAFALALAGRHAFQTNAALNYSAQFTTDSIQSTNLENNFTSRSYFKITLLPEYQFQFNHLDRLTVQAGASFDDTNRDSSAVSAVFNLAWLRQLAGSDLNRVHVSYAESSQVVGYTAIGGGTTGLFASDPNLKRETSQNLELGLQLERSDWSFETTAFYRWDDDLVDWTFQQGTPNARSANNVDIETFGLEFISTRRWRNFEGIVSYTYLHKNEDYRDDSIDASFYALNFAKHRVTLGAIWRPHPTLELRIDNQWRQNQKNALREGSDSAFFTHFGLSVYPSQIENLELFFAVDNLWDDRFQNVPGTPGRGDQYSAGATYRW